MPQQPPGRNGTAGVAATAAALAARARVVEPRCGSVTVVAIDGPSGSGKSSLAAALAGELGWPVISMDDLFPGWNGPAAASPLLVEQVLEPLSQGRPAGYRRWDWLAGTWDGWVSVAAGPGLIVEGCASSVGRAREFAALRVWVEADRDIRMARGLERDGESYRPHWERWATQEDELFGADGTRSHADVISRT